MGTPYKRSDPKKLQKEREGIVKQMEELKNVPQSERMFPNLIEQGRRYLHKKLEERYRRRNPPPRRSGADVVGFKRPKDTA